MFTHLYTLQKDAYISIYNYIHVKDKIISKIRTILDSYDNQLFMNSHVTLLIHPLAYLLCAPNMCQALF